MELPKRHRKPHGARRAIRQTRKEFPLPSEKSPALAAGLNLLFAGIGQFYAGAWARGIFWMALDAYSAWLLFSDFRAAPVRINAGYLVFTMAVTVASMVDAAMAAKAYNKKHLKACPRCGAKNQMSAPFCLVCGTNLDRGAFMPPPPPPPPPRPGQT